MSANNKTLKLAADLADRLAFEGLTIVEYTSGNSNPAVGVGAYTTDGNGTGQDAAVVVLKDFSSAGVDSLGTTMANFAHTVAYVYMHTDSSPGAADVLSGITAANTLKVLAAALALGCEVQLWACDTDNALSADADAASPTTAPVLCATWSPSLKSQNMGQQ